MDINGHMGVVDIHRLVYSIKFRALDRNDSVL
jgi:hypothetical protein